VAQHLADISPLLHTDPSLEQLARVIRRHKQREILRLGARDLSFRALPIEAMNEMTSLEAFRNYHETSADLWERQALIKSRFAVGNEDLGRDAETVALATAYGRGLEEKRIGEIHHLRIRMEKELADESQSRLNLKKCRGGIVDI
jgi:glutamine synthetase adenylyltransferase